MGAAASLIYFAPSGLWVSGTGDLLFAFALKGQNITAQGIRPVKDKYPRQSPKALKGRNKSFEP